MKSKGEITFELNPTLINNYDETVFLLEEFADQFKGEMQCCICTLKTNVKGTNIKGKKSKDVKVPTSFSFHYLAGKGYFSSHSVCKDKTKQLAASLDKDYHDVLESFAEVNGIKPYKYL